MRTGQFFITAIVAIATFISLQYFLGGRYGRPFGWHRGYYWHCRYDDGYYDHSRQTPYGQLPQNTQADSLKWRR